MLCQLPKSSKFWENTSLCYMASIWSLKVCVWFCYLIFEFVTIKQLGTSSPRTAEQHPWGYYNPGVQKISRLLNHFVGFFQPTHSSNQTPKDLHGRATSPTILSHKCSHLNTSYLWASFLSLLRYLWLYPWLRTVLHHIPTSKPLHAHKSICWAH